MPPRKKAPKVPYRDWVKQVKSKEYADVLQGLAHSRDAVFMREKGGLAAVLKHVKPKHVRRREIATIPLLPALGADARSLRSRVVAGPRRNNRRSVTRRFEPSSTSCSITGKRAWQTVRNHP